MDNVYWIVVAREVEHKKLKKLQLLSTNGQRINLTASQLGQFSKQNKVVNVKCTSGNLSGVGISLLDIPTFSTVNKMLVQVGGLTEQDIINAATPLIQNDIHQNNIREQREYDDRQLKIKGYIAKANSCMTILDSCLELKDYTNSRVINDKISRYMKEIDKDSTSDKPLQTLIEKQGILGLVSGIENKISGYTERARKDGVLDEYISVNGERYTVLGLFNAVRRKCNELREKHNNTRKYISNNKEIEQSHSKENLQGSTNNLEGSTKSDDISYFDSVMGQLNDLKDEIFDVSSQVSGEDRAVVKDHYSSMLRKITATIIKSGLGEAQCAAIAAVCNIIKGTLDAMGENENTSSMYEDLHLNNVNNLASELVEVLQTSSLPVGDIDLQKEATEFVSKKVVKDATGIDFNDLLDNFINEITVKASKEATNAVINTVSLTKKE